MFFKKALAVAAAVSGVVAQNTTRPMNTSICDYYTTALLKNNTAANQMTLLTLVVNTAVIGNYTMPNVGIKVAGILAPGAYNGTAVNLLPYFNGGFASSNRGGMSGVAVNFLDDGGAVPLMMNKPANGTSSNQYMLLTHLYQYFGVLLGCSMQGGSAYPAYAGSGSQYNVHKFMDLSAAEVGYFIQQVAMSAASFGVAQSDLAVVGTALNSLFNVRCAPATTVVPSQGAQLQSICIANNCVLAPNNTCAAYQNATRPAVATSSLVGDFTSTAMAGTATAAGAPAGTSSAAGGAATTTRAAGTGAAATIGVSFAAVFGGLAALLL